MKKEVLDNFKEKTVLVTGGAGAIGSNLVKKLAGLDTEKIKLSREISSTLKDITYNQRNKS